MLSKIKNCFLKTSILVSGTCGSVMAFADGTASKSDGTDLSPLTDAISFGSVVTAILAIAGLIAGLYAAVAGVKWVIRMIRSA